VAVTWNECTHVDALDVSWGVIEAQTQYKGTVAEDRYAQGIIFTHHLLLTPVAAFTTTPSRLSALTCRRFNKTPQSALHLSHGRS